MCRDDFSRSLYKYCFRKKETIIFMHTSYVHRVWFVISRDLLKILHLISFFISHIGSSSSSWQLFSLNTYFKNALLVLMSFGILMVVVLVGNRRLIGRFILRFLKEYHCDLLLRGGTTLAPSRRGIWIVVIIVKLIKLSATCPASSAMVRRRLSAPGVIFNGLRPDVLLSYNGSKPRDDAI